MLKTLINLLFPKYCLICNQIIADGYFCHSDFNKLHYISKPACKICSYPFEFEIDNEMLCPKCLGKKPPYSKALSIFRYDEISKKFIGNLKYRDNSHLAKDFAQIIYNHSQEILKNNINFIIPVPLHKKRLRKRKYNQSALIVKYLSQLTNITAIYDLLIRVKDTVPQTTLNKNLRAKNISGAFILNKKFAEIIKERNILLIDDVVTSGATIEACSKILLKAKVNKIYVITLAKTVLN